MSGPTFGHGGVRENQGRPMGAKNKPKDEGAEDYQVWRARNERAKALTAEHDLAIQQSAYLPREAISAASATAMAAFVQHCRGIADTLERTLGLTPEVSEAIGREIDEALGVLADDLSKLAKPAGG